jgi:hypothetical protein
MNPFRFAVVAGLAGAALAMLAAPVRAQEVPVGPPPMMMQDPGRQPKPTEQNVRIDVSVALKGTKPMVKTLSMVTADGRPASGRAGLEIPVMLSGEGLNYRNVGVNVDATPQILPSGRINLRLKLQFTNVYKSEVPEVPQPTFGSGSTDLQGIIFESGKPVSVSVASDGEAGREYTVQVTATILK